MFFFRIDYQKATACLVEIKHDGNPESLIGWRPKHWVFEHRELGYMQGWQNILDAMKVAVAECKKILEAELAESKKIKKEIVKKTIKALKENGK